MKELVGWVAIGQVMDGAIRKWLSDDDLITKNFNFVEDANKPKNHRLILIVRVHKVPSRLQVIV